MGCKLSAPREEREEGLCVIEVVRCQHLPNMDVTSLTDAYVKVRFIDEIDPSIHPSDKLKTSVQWNSLNPVYHSYLGFPVFPNETDTVELKIVDEDVMSQNDNIGTALVPFIDLVSCIGKEVTLDIKLERGLHSEDGGNPSITIRLVKLERKVSPHKIRKEFFLIRHGESIWNESQEGKCIKGMVSQYDHELTKLGIEQARSFNKRWKNIQQNSSEDECGDLKAFLAASAVFSSPLTRATQTALLTCENHPALVEDPLVLLRQLREVKNFGSFDTVGKYMGADIAANVREKLIRDMGAELADDLLRVEIDPHDAADSWWTPLQEKEGKERVQKRLTDLFSFLRYGASTDSAVLVGHSHFFRHMVRELMSPEYRQKEPAWTALLSKNKLDNGGCLRVVVEWDSENSPMEHPVILSARLVFGSKLAGIEESQRQVSEASQRSSGEEIISDERISTNVDTDNHRSPNHVSKTSPVNKRHSRTSRAYAAPEDASDMVSF